MSKSQKRFVSFMYQDIGAYLYILTLGQKVTSFKILKYLRETSKEYVIPHIRSSLVFKME